MQSRTENRESGAGRSERDYPVSRFSQQSAKVLDGRGRQAPKTSETKPARRAVHERANSAPASGIVTRMGGNRNGFRERLYSPRVEPGPKATPGCVPRVMLWSAQKQGTDLDYIVHISRGSDGVATHSVEADTDAQAFDLAIEWAASLLLAADDDVVLAIQLPSGAFKTFSRKDF
jgi:hypothetical protein